MGGGCVHLLRHPDDLILDSIQLSGIDDRLIVHISYLGEGHYVASSKYVASSQLSGTPAFTAIFSVTPSVV